VSPRPRPESLLLALVGTALFFGGGFGCVPDARGADFRPASVLSVPGNETSPLDWYMAFTGKGAPGTVAAALPYALKAPFGVSARLGVFVPEARHASQDARGCIGFADRASSEDFRICIRVFPLRLRIFSNLDGAYPNFNGVFADCLPASHVELQLADDGATVTASYRCDPADTFATLLTAASRWRPSEKWDPFVSATGLAKGAQIGLDNLLITSTDPGIEADPDPEAVTAFQTLTAFQRGLDSFYALESDAPDRVTVAAGIAGLAHDSLLAAQLSLVPAFGQTSGADKLLAKSESTQLRLLETLEAGATGETPEANAAEKFQKGFLKLPGLEANALEALATGF
jgi:hypothetical protein